jgi:hypothetical protein
MTLDDIRNSLELERKTAVSPFTERMKQFPTVFLPLRQWRSYSATTAHRELSCLEAMPNHFNRLSIKNMRRSRHQRGVDLDPTSGVLEKTNDLFFHSNLKLTVPQETEP